MQSRTQVPVSNTRLTVHGSRAALCSKRRVSRGALCVCHMKRARSAAAVALARASVCGGRNRSAGRQSEQAAVAASLCLQRADSVCVCACCACSLTGQCKASTYDEGTDHSVTSRRRENHQSSNRSSSLNSKAIRPDSTPIASDDEALPTRANGDEIERSRPAIDAIQVS